MITQVERQMILQTALSTEAAQGNRVAWVGSGVAYVWRTPAPINHVVHAVISLFIWVWPIVWFLLYATQAKAQLFGIGVRDDGTLFTFDVQDYERWARAQEAAQHRAFQVRQIENARHTQLH